MAEEHMLTVREVAERLRAHPETIREWIRQGTLHGVQPGGKKLGYRIPASEVTRLLSGDIEGKTKAAA